MSKLISPKRLSRSLGRFMLIDLLIDKQARPVFGYVVGTILVGAIIYHFVEGWNWLDSIYFVVITTTTIGYGDFSPDTELGKVLTIFFGLNGVAILVLLFDQIRRVRVPAQSEAEPVDDGTGDPGLTA